MTYDKIIKTILKGDRVILKTRNPTLDLIRVLAGLFVCGVHFFLYTGFYSEKIVDGNMYLPVLVRVFMGMCVPMFLVLSGYLMNSKTPCKSYYRGIVKTLVVYVLAGICGLLYEAFYLKSQVTILSGFLRIFDFSSAKYAWYVEMYIGLFLLIPFLNMGYHALKSRKKKLALVITLCILTSLPSLVNVFNFTIDGWWQNPVLSKEYQAIVPDYWVSLYPMTYYFIGAYLKEYPPKLSKTKLFVLLIISLNLFAVYNIYRSWGNSITSGSWTNWCSFEQVIDTTLLFALLLKVKLDKAPKSVKYVLAKLSDLTLGTYLISYLFDRTIYYDYFGKWVYNFFDKFKYYPFMVLTIYILSALASLVLNLISKPIIKFIFFISKKTGEFIKKHKSESYDTIEEKNLESMDFGSMIKK